MTVATLVCYSLYLGLYFGTILPSSSGTEANRSRLQVHWTSWTAWSGCSSSCGSGVQKRNRRCLLGRLHASKCRGLLVNARPCGTTTECPGPEIQPWSEWSTCTCSCGGGLRKRTKTCTGGIKCTGNLLEVAKCNTLPCPYHPSFSVQPQSQTKLLGQSVRFCCKATGHPVPTYEWLKDSQPISEETSNFLLLRNLSINDKGTYHCRAISRRMIRLSQPAFLTIHDRTNDRCSSVLPQLIRLPEGCFVRQNGVNSSWIDVGQCRKDSCVKRERQTTDTKNSCGRSPNCCQTASTVYKIVRCSGGNRLRFPVVSRCRCGARSYSTNSITLTIVGADNQRPIPYATVILNGQNAAISNNDGKVTFRFERSTGIQWNAAEIRDMHNGEYSDLSTVIPIIPGEDITHTVYLQKLAEPMELNLTQTVEIPLSNSDSPQPPASILIIQQGSIVNDVSAVVNSPTVQIQYIDPRSRSDMKIEWGRSVAVGGIGNEIPLNFYGIVKVDIRGGHDEKLELMESAEWFVDASALAVPRENGDGKPLLKLFTLNPTGVWEEAGHTELVTRRCLHSSVSCLYAVGRVTTFSRIWSLGVPSEKTCYVKVRSYDGNGREIGGVLVSMAGSLSTGQYYGIRRNVTRIDGGACVSTRCDVGGTIYAHLSDGIAANPNPPPQCCGTIPANDHNSIRFPANATGQPPVYGYSQEMQCVTAPGTDPHFSFTSPQEETEYTVNSEPFHFNSWYFLPYRHRKYCYVRVKIYSNHYEMVRVWSFANNGRRSLYGWRDVIAQQQNSSSVDVCVEYRCCGSFSQNREKYVSTRVLISPRLRNGTLCTRYGIAARLRPYYLSSAPYQLSFVPPRNGWGPAYGTYRDSNKNSALSQCCMGKVNSDGTCGHHAGMTHVPGTTYQEGHAVAFVCSTDGKHGNGIRIY